VSTAEQQVIPAAEARAADQERVSLLATFAHRYGLEANNMMRTLRATVLRPASNGTDPSNEQVAAFMIVANQHSLNPFTKEVHGFVDKRGGIVPIVGVDGCAKLAHLHPQFDGMSFEQDDEKCTCTIFRKDRAHPIVVTEYLTECKQGSPAWQSHPKRMLRHRAMVQAMRLAFSFAGVYDPDEGEQVLAAQDAIDVTPGNEVIPAGKKVGPKKLREIVDGLLEAVKADDGKKLWAVWRELDSDQQLFVWNTLRSWEKSAIKKLQDSSKQYKYGDDIDAWAVEAMRSCKDPAALQTAWSTIQDAFAENDAEVPGDVETVYIDRKAELGVVS